MAENGKPRRWAFLTNHGQVLVCIAHDPGVRLSEISRTVGITEGAAHRIVTELVGAGYVTRKRIGRRNHYTIQVDLPLPDAPARGRRVGDLLTTLTGATTNRASEREPAPKAGSRAPRE